MPYLPYDLTNTTATTVGTALSATGTSLSVATGGGALLLKAGGPPFFVLLGASTGQPEVAQATAVSSDTVTLVRGVNGKTSAWAVGDTVQVARLVSEEALFTAVAAMLYTANLAKAQVAALNGATQGMLTLTGNAAVATGAAGTVATAALGISRVVPAADRTGCILAAGTIDGQVIVVENTSASHSITFDVAGTSNVADGVSSSVAALTSTWFVWDATAALWYRVV